MTQKQKILLAFILPAAVALLTIAFFLEKSHRQLAIERWSIEHKALVNSISQATRAQLDEAQSLLVYTGQLNDFARLEAVDRIDRQLNGIPLGVESAKRRTLDALLAKTQALSIVFLLLPNGDHYLSHPYKVQRALKKYNLADRLYFQEARRTKKPVVSDSVIGADGKLAVIVDIPLLDGKGQIYAHLGGVVLLKNLSNLLESARIKPFDKGMLIDSKHHLIADTDLKQIGPEQQFFPYKHPLLEVGNNAASGVRFLRWTDDQGIEWLSFAQTMDNGWTLILQRQLSGVVAEYAGAVRQTVLLVALILALTGSIGLSMALVIVRRWEAADGALNQARDELEARVSERTAELAASEARLAKSRDFYLSVLEGFPALIWRSGLDTKCDYFNRTWLEFTGRSLAEELGDGWADGVHPDDLAQCIETYLSAFAKRQAFAMEFRLRRHDGEYRWILDVGRPFYDINDLFIGYLGACFDVSERHAAADQLQLVASVFLHAREGIIITDAETRIIDVNQAFSTITGYARDEVIGRQPNLLRSPHQKGEFYQAMWNELETSGHWQGEIWNRKKNGEEYAELLTISAVCDSQHQLTHYVGIFADITQQKENEQRLEHLAHFDPLTELPNRTLLGDRLHMSIAQAQRNNYRLAVCLLDLDGFKQVNDNLGHAAGDQLLIEFAQRLREELRQTDTLARLGGDEFVVLLNELSGIDECIEAVHRIIQAASRPYTLGEQHDEVSVSTSIGITLYPDDGVDPDLLLRHADQAMYIAKQGGGNRYFMFDPLKDNAARAERNAIDRLEQALATGEFVLHYQPKVDMRRGDVIGAEALIRWQHPDRGLLMPGEFLPLIEDSELSIPLGRWVIRQALHQLSAWQTAGLSLSVSVNISPHHLQQGCFAEDLESALGEFPAVSPQRLQLEILETAALRDTRNAAETIAACRAQGVSFALDDFGTGYSSLLYLKHLPADTLKIDQSFVRNMLHDPEHLAIVKGVIGLARAFNRTVIAEGVETVPHGDSLLDCGCDLAQGFGIAQAMPGEHFAAWMQTWQAPASWTDNRPA